MHKLEVNILSQESPGEKCTDELAQKYSIQMMEQHTVQPNQIISGVCSRIDDPKLLCSNV